MVTAWPEQTETANRADSGQLQFWSKPSEILNLGGKYLFFVSSRSVKMRGFSFLSLYKNMFIFQFLNVKMYNYGKQNITQ